MFASGAGTAVNFSLSGAALQAVSDVFIAHYRQALQLFGFRLDRLVSSSPPRPRRKLLLI